METAGVALSAVALLASLSTAIDGYLLLSEVFAAQDDSHYLALRYGFEKQRLECWKQEVQKPTYFGTHQLEVLPPLIKQLIRAALVEIHITHQEVDKIVAKHHAPPIDPSVDAPMDQLNILDAQEEKKYRKSKAKGRATWVIRDKARFSEKVEKLEKITNNLYEILGLDISRTASLALTTYTVAQISQASTLEFLQSHSRKSALQNERFILNCASLKLLETSPSVLDVPILTSNSLDLDFPDNPRSMGFYKQSSTDAQRVLVDVDDRKKIHERIKLLAALLNLPKEPDFRVPTCIGLCPHPGSPLKYGYVFTTPFVSASIAVISPLALGTLLEKAKISSTKALLGSRFKLAHTLASSFALLHSAGWLHKNFHTHNILFFSQFNPVIDSIPVERMYIVGFDYARPAIPGELSIEYAQPGSDPDNSLYQHPGVTSGFRKLHDIYSLGVVLFEIALWRSLKTKFPSSQASSSLSAGQKREALISAVDVLGGEVGATYRDVVKVCLTGDFGDEVMEDESLLPKAFLIRVVNALEGC